MDISVKDFSYQLVDPEQKVIVTSYKKGIVGEDIELQELVAEHGDKLLQGIEVMGYDAKLAVWIE